MTLISFKELLPSAVGNAGYRPACVGFVVGALLCETGLVYIPVAV